MSGLQKIVSMAVLLLALVLAAAIAVAGCGGGAPPSSEQKPETLPTNEIVNRALKVLTSTSPTGEFPNNSISGVRLATMVANSEERSKTFLLDTRAKADYDQGHIEGSTQVDFGKWAAPENLAKYPRDKRIVVVDYLDDYSGEIVAGLRMLGYDALALRGGINGWAQGFQQSQIAQELSNTDYPVEITPGAVVTPVPAGVAFDAPSGSDSKLLVEKANSIFSGQKQGANSITAEDLNRQLQAEESARPFVLDIRPRVDFNQGHIAGAVNIQFAALGVPENLLKVPKDRKIVVVCSFASSAAQIMTTLRMLDYDSVQLKHSMMSWNGFGKNTFLEYIQTASNPVVKSS